jgi:hypothetical protein
MTGVEVVLIVVVCALGLVSRRLTEINSTLKELVGLLKVKGKL